MKQSSKAIPLRQCDRQLPNGLLVADDDVKWRVALVVHGVDVGSAADEKLGGCGARKLANVVGVEVVDWRLGADAHVQQRTAVACRHAKLVQIEHEAIGAELFPLRRRLEELGEDHDDVEGCVDVAGHFLLRVENVITAFRGISWRMLKLF
jgi:hypothetical protein